MIEIIGWLASVCFAISCVPFAYQALKTGKTDAPLSAILLILSGASGMFIYEAFTAQQLPQLLDFGMSASAWGVVLFVKLKADKASN